MAEKVNVIELSEANVKELEIKLDQQQQLIAKLEEDILKVFWSSHGHTVPK